LRAEKGNFLLQALMALTLVFAFIPFFAQRLASRDVGAQMYAATRQIETAKNAARLYIVENASSFPYETTSISGEKFSDTLEPYGLPLGFVPRTPLGQNMELLITKTDTDVFAVLRISGGNLAKIQLAELARRIGFYASYNPDSDTGVIDVGIPLAESYSDVVRRNETNSDLVGFLADLDMGNFSLKNVSGLFGRRGEFDTAEIDTLSISGTEAGRRAKNNIKELNVQKTVFQNKDGESALSVGRGTLHADTLVGRTVSKFGDTGVLEVIDGAADTFDMAQGRTGFVGPQKWTVHGNVVTSRISFTTEQLNVSSFLNATRGQDVFVDEDSLSYSTSSGIDAAVVRSSHITLRDQTSSGLSRGDSGAVLLDIRPAGTSVLPDVAVDTINNDAFSILQSPKSEETDFVDCKSVISSLGVTYNQKSLAQNIICQYVYWQRLETRINIKKCLQEGRSGC